MPFYDYKCNKCGQTFEAVHGMGGQPVGLQCEFCGAKDLQRIFHPVGTMKAGGGGADHASASGSCASCASGSCGSCKH